MAAQDDEGSSKRAKTQDKLVSIEYANSGHGRLAQLRAAAKVYV